MEHEGRGGRRPAAGRGLLATGMTVREIAEEIGIGKSVVHRMKQRIDREAKEAAADHDEGE